ncbi:hypothetical protein TGPRC2_269015 [Toxoplasma gondii TgCatPRC2]|uniref:Uncharacterized protein n=3 Tax=Toxoplasma gondii TaxID=5811 RepID=A0A151HNI1_TOXGO|nr:hypothetical protein TGME49_269015 [Toxoplasma gondii ME49]EPT28293.1 hypothetical protein TGME49_269015 [Toxoplasma gondii ME49]KYF47119.1 hypothetical protein TGARI_269015 [Toxoplasma gondii ARI]KYK70882.1 hypothetical protein TGPRC2_269015 [Toxoplasma gondii TgCatPRC2]|eukprot:XP_018636562.1 hypothetical protein TGME49_269015 [Toxoplasma gondii ME49]
MFNRLVCTLLPFLKLLGKQSTRTEKRRHLDVSKELSDPFRGLPRHRPPAASLTTASAHSDVLHAKTNAFGPTSEGNGPCARSPAIGATSAKALSRKCPGK